MVNTPSELSDRRQRPRIEAEHAPALGAAPSLNPFGDLMPLQQLGLRLAHGVRDVIEPVLRSELRSFAEPIAVQRWADYRESRDKALTAWFPLEIGSGKPRALLVIDGALLLEMLDRFFGGTGEGPAALPPAFSPAAEALLERLAAGLCDALHAAWQPLAPLSFRPLAPIGGAHLAPGSDAGEAMVVTRFGLAAPGAKPVFLDILYPVTALRPHGDALTTRVHDAPAAVEPKWRTGLTRAVMSVRLPVRSVLAEPVVSLATLLALKAGDVIPIEFGTQVPVMVADQRFATGILGAANGRAAIQLTALEPLNQEDIR